MAPLLLEAGKRRQAFPVNSRRAFKWLSSWVRDSLKGKENFRRSSGQKVGWADVIPLLEEEEPDSSRNKWRKGSSQVCSWAEERNEGLNCTVKAPMQQP